MVFHYTTMDDVELEDKTVLLRLDLNSPMRNSDILDDKRFRSHLPTLRELDRSRTVILAHQSRPGKNDFTTMELHASLLSDLIKKDVGYVDDIFGSTARKSINGMKKGEVLLLENVRFYAEEMLSRTPEEHANSHMVRKLSPLFDLFINDAFSAAHRSHLSIVGFSSVLKTVVGRVMEREISALEQVKGSKRPRLFVLGGVKVDDSIRIAEHVLSNGIADSVLLTGLVANVFLASKMDIGKPNMDFIRSQGYVDQIDKARAILNGFNNILLPKDVALKKDKERIESDIPDRTRPRSGIDYPIYDIGSKTIEFFSNEIKKARTIVMNGPSGVFEEEKFGKGTFELMKAAEEVEFSVIGGGHTCAVADKIDAEFSHVSMGGGACLSYLAGEELPGVEVLKIKNN
jgi:phosphoglycerate kinase